MVRRRSGCGEGMVTRGLMMSWGRGVVRSRAGCGVRVVTRRLMMSWVRSVVVNKSVRGIDGHRVVDICSIHPRREIDRSGGGGGLDNGRWCGVGVGGVAVHGRGGGDHLRVGQRGGAVPVDRGRGGGGRDIHRDSLALCSLMEVVAGVGRGEVGEAIEGAHTRRDS